MRSARAPATARGMGDSTYPFKLFRAVLALRGIVKAGMVGVRHLDGAVGGLRWSGKGRGSVKVGRVGAVGRRNCANEASDGLQAMADEDMVVAESGQVER